jgi:hypothetical protein
MIRSGKAGIGLSLSMQIRFSLRVTLMMPECSSLRMADLEAGGAGLAEEKIVLATAQAETLVEAQPSIQQGAVEADIADRSRV